MTVLPDPHPLDFDWRYTEHTVAALYTLLPSEGSILAVGAPSIARSLEAARRTVTLIDRQPFQGVANHLVSQPGHELPDLQKFEGAIVDPPWYFFDLGLWTAWTANIIGLHRQIIVSFWPSDVRPDELEETQDLLNWLSSWAEVEILPVIPEYETPIFESVARAVSSNGNLSTSPKAGRLLHLRAKTLPPIPRLAPSLSRWVRFVINNYQLAVRIDQFENGKAKIQMHPAARNWTWPYVSRRAPGRENISVWSSQNEVAVATNSNALISALRAALSAQNAAQFDEELSLFPELATWAIPRPPYWRVFEWQHQQ